jgi:NodT family efflux transporter outer membrane factor (OMF) lipoprotein
MTKKIFITLTGCSLAACTAGPDYVQPTPVLPQHWQSTLDQPAALDTKLLATWWTTFHDPQLAELINRAIGGNFDLKKALARIKEARAQRGIAQADYFPRINSSGSTGENYNGASDQRNGRYSLGLDASWELNLFGQVSRSVENAQASLEAIEANYQDVIVSLVAEVGLNYIQLRTLQNRLTVAEQNLTAQSEVYQLTDWRWQAGLGNKLDAEQALSSVEQLKAQIPALKTQMAQTQNQLALLLGIAPATLNQQLASVKPIPVADLKIAIGVPADVLRQRPDIKRAERELAAQTAQIGVAAAAHYPKLTLSGSIGLEAIKASHLFSTAGLIDSLLGKLTFPIFNAGAIRQNIQVQSARQEQALANYETIVLTAVKEVENALVGIAQEQQRQQNLTAAIKTAQRAVILARNQYASGLIDFQNVLQTQRSLLSLQDQMTQSQGQVSTYMISLYKALGGGWRS